MAGVAKASLGEGRGDEKGEAAEDLDLVKDGTKPGGASGLTPRRGEPERGVALPRHEAGDGRRRMVWRMGGGEAAFPTPSRYRHNTSSIALSSEEPVKVVWFRRRSSSLSVLSSSSSVASWRIGRQISKCSSDTMFARFRTEARPFKS